MTARMAALYVWLALAGDTRMKSSELADLVGLSRALCRKTLLVMERSGLLARGNGRVWRAVDDAKAAELLRAARLRAP